MWYYNTEYYIILKYSFDFQDIYYNLADNRKLGRRFCVKSSRVKSINLGNSLNSNFWQFNMEIRNAFFSAIRQSLQQEDFGINFILYILNFHIITWLYCFNACARYHDFADVFCSSAGTSQFNQISMLIYWWYLLNWSRINRYVNRIMTLVARNFLCCRMNE